MTREENRKLVEGLRRPLLELAFKKAVEAGVEINVHASEKGTAWLDIGDYNLVISGGNMTLRYNPKGRIEEWEDEWREDVSELLAGKKMSFAEMLGEDHERKNDNTES